VKVNYIDIPQPKIGNKIMCIQDSGIYVLERGPCSLRGMINTRIGNGAISGYDALPDDNGRIAPGSKLIFNASPPILGSWAPDGGCDIGLTLVFHESGGMNNHPPCTTVTWVPYREPKRRIENV
jgi:hypothetical protein